ncbi:glutamyl-tRNA(Gln) amidotransferase subunit C, mitochondrial [Episyrphus balteatus]|uniref:glutamyl-tRNA(Gln) amidotransferase subunit C, mitochondrial n=1 Tax=Episyrphus balteatus TaxID=286459 RepID=UPI002484E2EF|nr:glutamyl-tRNA(Gln) amidotransferase subunit C, mitochondrial [Episyrphus balteatus]
MYRRVFIAFRPQHRFFCNKKALDTTCDNSKINWKELKYETKVPLEPVIPFIPESQDIEIDSKTIQLLERLSLVDLDSKEALKTLKDSIQFANRIIHIDTNSVEPLYTVLEDQNLELREDIVTDGNIKQEILANAKKTDEDYFVAPPGNIPLEQEEKNFN